MKIKRFEAPSMSEALRLIKKEFGEEAVILSAKSQRKNKGFLGKKEGQEERPDPVFICLLSRHCFPGFSGKVPESQSLQAVSLRVEHLDQPSHIHVGC